MSRVGLIVGDVSAAVGEIVILYSGAEWTVRPSLSVPMTFKVSNSSGSMVVRFPPRQKPVASRLSGSWKS